MHYCVCPPELHTYTVVKVCPAWCLTKLLRTCAGMQVQLDFKVRQSCSFKLGAVACAVASAQAYMPMCDICATLDGHV